MKKLAEGAWQAYKQFDQSGCLVHPSIPILYFGDHEKYASSSLKIVTVALNPSKREFPEKSPFSRFPGAEQSYQDYLKGGHYDAYLRALNRYFYEDPYTSWFGFFEEVLAGFDCSYYGNKSYTALHTDLLSPLATNPTWSSLSPDKKRSLSSSGIPLWHKLIEYLLPDVILVSIRRSFLDEIKFRRLGGWKTVLSVERRNPYDVSVQQIEIKNGKTAYIVFGKAANKPFGTIKHSEKNKIGNAVMKYIKEKGENV